MVFISNKPFVLLICIGLLVVLPEKVSSLTRSDFSLKWSTQQQNEQMMLKTRRMLNGLVKNELNTGIKSAPKIGEVILFVKLVYDWDESKLLYRF
ncbi:hypothetical protein K7X08_006523 [Anisodus acutangulus]|uniref:Uncharacterized protein n=1 Tax=Anisodus acutangulus TaxID=402998 RepID=A0A9Q1MVM7_9SOLA|nr:hypothetical protein K7X08_006523 [Anisodus acutangulus]